MKDVEILKQAFDKALENGWDAKTYIVAVEYLLDRGIASHIYRIFIFFISNYTNLITAQNNI